MKFGLYSEQTRHQMQVTSCGFFWELLLKSFLQVMSKAKTIRFRKFFNERPRRKRTGYPTKIFI